MFVPYDEEQVQIFAFFRLPIASSPKTAEVGLFMPSVFLPNFGISEN